MEAIILAGGAGTRLKQVVPDLPKPMAPIAGRPFLEILLHGLAAKGFTRAVLSLGFMSEKVVDHFGEYFAGMTLAYEIEDYPLGTGGALRRALSSCKNDHAFVFNGDTYLDLEVMQVEEQWQANRLPVIVTREVADTARYGRVLVTEGGVAEFSEKSMVGPGLINAGCYVLPRDIFEGSPFGSVFSFESDFLNHEVRRRRFDAFVTRGYFIDIGVPADYERAQMELARV